MIITLKMIQSFCHLFHLCCGILQFLLYFYLILVKFYRQVIYIILQKFNSLLDKMKQHWVNRGVQAQQRPYKKSRVNAYN